MPDLEKKLWCLAAVLILLFPLSFIIQNNRNNLKSVKTAFLNPKFEKNLTSIEIGNSYDKIFLLRKNDGWTVSKDSSIFPADQKSVYRLIESLMKIRTLEEISSKNDFFDASNSFDLTYELKDGFKTKFYTGKTDISETKISIKTENKGTIYYTDNDISAFLNMKISFWIEPELIPESWKISGDSISRISLIENGKRKVLSPEANDFEEKSRKLLSLRHGQTVDTFNENEISRLEIFLSDGSKITLGFNRTEDDSYCVNCFTSEYNYNVSVSSWTYEKLRELFN